MNYDGAQRMYKLGTRSGKARNSGCWELWMLGVMRLKTQEVDNNTEHEDRCEDQGNNV
jgi:hypothetical protein